MASLIKYIKDTRGEMRHVAWPTQMQTAVYTILVIAISAVVAAYLGFFDFLFTETLNYGLNFFGGSQASGIELSTSTPEAGAVPNGASEGADGIEFNVEGEGDTPVEGVEVDVE